LRRLVQGASETLVVNWQLDGNRMILLRCTFALSPFSTAAVRAKLGQTDMTPLFWTMPSASRDDNGVSQRLDLVLLNREALSDELSQPVPADAIVETTLSYRAKDH
jgi:hypothetical protein